MKKTFVIFDIDGTLLYSNKIDSQCFATTYEMRYRSPFPTIDWHQYPHVTDDTIFTTVIKNQFSRTPSLAEIEDFKDEFVALLKEKRRENPTDFKEIPQSKATIDQLLDNPSFEVGIGTGGWRKPALLKLEHIQVPHQQLVLGAADGNPTREDILNQVLREGKQNFEFDDVVYIGDASWDVRTTRNLNMKFIGIRRNGDAHFLEKLGATQVLQDYTDYQKFLSAIKIATPPK